MVGPPTSYTLCERSGTPSYLRLPAFEDLTRGRVRLAISTRHGGVSEGPYSSLNLGLSTGDDHRRVGENRARLSIAVGVEPRATVGMSQVHGAHVARVGSPEGGTSLPATDGLVTMSPALALRALAADCVPIALCDPRQGAIAVVHAGWRGILAGVVPAAVALLVGQADTAPGDLVVALGPGIGPCHYEVGLDVADPFTAAFSGENERVVVERLGRAYLDLPAALGVQLRGCGIPAENILHTGLCTACRTDLFYSHRAERHTGRFGLLAWLAW